MCSALVESFYKISTVVDTWNMPVSIDVESFYKISTVVDQYYTFYEFLSNPSIRFLLL